MKSFFARLLCRLLVLCMFATPFTVNAGIIGTDQAQATASQSAGVRDRVLNFVERSDVRSQLESLGLSPERAKDRVNALTDQEVAQLAGRIDALPAGADGGSLLLLILLGVLIWWLVR